MKLDVPTGTTFYWNPYSPKFYTIVQSPLAGSSRAASSSVCSDDEGSFHNMNFSSSASSSINTSFVKSRPSDDVYNLGWSTISSVRQEKTTDAAVCAMVQRFPYKTLTAMAAVIENSPNLFLELCEKERGNVVAHVIGALNGDRCDELINLAVDNIYRLATHQSGCIALTRIMDGASPCQVDAISVALVQHFDALMCHQYGNFVLSRVAQSAAEAQVMEYFCSAFESLDVLTTSLNDKFGSHVFEAYVKNCNANHLFRVCAVLFSDIDFVMSVATSRFANYPLQACLRQMMSHDTQHELSQWALATIPTLVQDTKFATNINRALGFGRTADQQGQGMQRNNGPRRVRATA